MVTCRNGGGLFSLTFSSPLSFVLLWLLVSCCKLLTQQKPNPAKKKKKKKEEISGRLEIKQPPGWPQEGWDWLAGSSTRHGTGRRTSRKWDCHHWVNSLQLYIWTRGQTNPRADVREGRRQHVTSLREEGSAGMWPLVISVASAVLAIRGLAAWQLFGKLIDA